METHRGLVNLGGSAPLCTGGCNALLSCAAELPGSMPRKNSPFFERALTHLQTLVTSSILPFERQLASSTRLLGLTHGRQGLHRRPMMMHQDKTIDILVRHFAHSELPNDSPTVPSLNPYRHLEVEACDEMHSRNWTEREKALKSWRKRSKGRRAREGGPFP